MEINLVVTLSDRDVAALVAHHVHDLPNAEEVIATTDQKTICEWVAEELLHHGINESVTWRMELEAGDDIMKAALTKVLSCNTPNTSTSPTHSRVTVCHENPWGRNE